MVNFYHRRLLFSFTSSSPPHPLLLLQIALPKSLSPVVISDSPHRRRCCFKNTLDVSRKELLRKERNVYTLP